MPAPPKPRIPGSQVAPGQRPLFRDADTASTHSKVPLDQATAGRLYRVRCKDWVTVHGENLTYADANILKDQVAAKGYRTARVEDMSVPPPEWYEAPDESVDPDPAPLPDQLELGAAGALETLREPAIRAGALEADAANRRVSDHGAAARAAQLAAMTGSRPVVVALPDAPPPPPPPPPSPKQSRFVAAPVAPKPKPPQSGPRKAYRDKTVQPVVRRTEPPPRDRTVSTEILKRASAPPSAPPVPYISPLKAAMMQDDLDIPDGLNVVDDSDLSDLMVDVGGAASEADVERAKAQADAERRARGTR